ncbi:MAG: asparagine synthase (glutamine-hydrolyzing), partial [Bacteroidota bacterium]
MCGIAGIVFSEKQDHSEIDFSASLNLLNHRGPDASGIYKDQKVCLGHQRLSIIDLNENANQPFRDEDFVLIFNGEIYNYKSLRQPMIDKGLKFKTESDTEVLFELLKEQGESALESLQGCFSFAFYSIHEKKLLLTRDPFGINPLYYAQTEKGFLFASEMRTLFSLEPKFELDHNAIRNYFDLSYIPSPLSISQNAKKLEPGHYLIVSEDKIALKSFHSINRKVDRQISYVDASQKLRNILDAAVAKRLVSDVPLGTFLSGGIDSSIISAIASKHVTGLSTFSIGFENASFYDETEYAEEVAERIGSHHKTIRLADSDLIESAKEILRHIDEPFADSSAIAVNLLCKEVSKHITVALSGDGADEIFSGYNKHKAENMFINKAPLTRWIKLIPRLGNSSRDGRFSNLFRQLNKLKEGANLAIEERYEKWLYQLNFSNEILLDNTPSSNEFIEDLYIKDMNDILYWDTKTILSNDMLYKVDMCSMKNSLEVRTPFLDKEVVNFAFSLPVDYKLKGSKTKRILRDTFKTELPYNV